MKTNLKDAVLEIVEIVKAVPEPFKERCFELLLTYHLESQTSGDPKSGHKHTPPANSDPEGENDESKDDGQEQADIQPSDLHVKARKFLEKQGRNIADLNEVFFKEGDEFEPLYDDLKTTKLAESQIRIGLMRALRSGLSTGDFVFSGEDVRTEAQTRKCYDAANFSANFNNNSALFDGFEKYKKASPIIRLSDAGKKRLSSLIVELKG